MDVFDPFKGLDFVDWDKWFIDPMFESSPEQAFLVDLLDIIFPSLDFGEAAEPARTDPMFESGFLDTLVAIFSPLLDCGEAANAATYAVAMAPVVNEEQFLEMMRGSGSQLPTVVIQGIRATRQCN